MPATLNISSCNKFMDLVVAARKPYLSFRINHHAIRLLRNSLNAAATNQQHQAETLSVVYTALSLEKAREITPKHVQQWLTSLREEGDGTKRVDDDDDEAEVASAGDLSGEQLHGVRKVFDSFRDRETKVTYYLVD